MMARRWLQGCLGVAGCLALSLPVKAQIVPDTTLPTNSRVIGNLTCFPSCEITGGTQRNGNLFHSFTQFSVRGGGEAFFDITNTPSPVQNIFARVTGRFPSNINGTIRVNGTADLFLLNPNGILFGPNAQLQVGGSFIATTANSFKFPDGSEFSAVNPQSPPLLTVNVTPGLQFGNNPQPIRIQGLGIRGVPFGFNLEVNPGKMLALIGGNIESDGGVFRAPGGQIELGGLSAAGTVNFTSDGHLIFPDGLPQANVRLTGNSIADAPGDNGSIAINARNIDILNGSQLRSSTASIDSPGNISLKAQNAITLAGRGDFFGLPSPVFIGNFDRETSGATGSINIETGTLTMRDGAQISSSVVSSIAVGGDITINARDSILVDGSNPIQINGQVLPAAITSGVVDTRITSGVVGIGQGGDIRITTGSLKLTNGSQISTSVVGLGFAGDITIQARDVVSFEGANPVNNLPSGITAALAGIGKGGDVSITASSLSLGNGAQINTSLVFGAGLAGKIDIQARDTVFIGGNRDGLSSGIASELVEAIGRGGDIGITAGSLTLSDSGFLSTATFGGAGKAGDVVIRARDSIFLTGSNSRIQTATSSSGSGGDIDITTGSFIARNRSFLFSGTSGSGNSGSIRIRARDTVSLDNAVGIATTTASSGSGGDIDITTGSFVARNESALLSGTFGPGNSGSIRIRAQDTVSLDNALISSAVLAFGDIFSILQESRITNLLTPEQRSDLTNSLALIGASVGSAGNIDINARSIRLNGGSITSFTTSGRGGDINLQARELLLLRRSSLISTQAGILAVPITRTSFSGSGGNITINTPFIVAAPMENSDIVANSFGESGGRLTINAQSIYWMTPRSRAELQSLLGTNDPFELRPERLPTNDITSFSQSRSDLPEQVFINTLNIDPTSGLVELPTLLDPSNQIDQRCNPNAQRRNSFTITGRGGLASSPIDPLKPETVTVDLVQLPDSDPISQQNPHPTPHTHSADTHGESPHPTPNSSIIEAQNWIIDSNGDIVLIAASPTAIPQTFPLPAPDCTTPPTNSLIQSSHTDPPPPLVRHQMNHRKQPKS